MHAWGLALALAASGCARIFGLDTPTIGGDGGVPDDRASFDGIGGVDGAGAASAACTSDTALVLCYSFEQNPLPATVPDEGTAAVDAMLTNVTSTPSPSGRAALLDTTSEIFVPYTAAVSGVMSIEMWFRVDQDPAVGGRAGLVDSNLVPGVIDLFVYNNAPSPHSLRCGIGNVMAAIDAPAFQVGTWQYAACVCTGSALTLYLNGTSLGSASGDCTGGGALANPDGLTIGSNNNGGAAGVNDFLVGAIDGVKLWTRALTAQDVCAHAGKTGC